jgi:para-aminobenzoate synthetase component 1
VQRLDISADDLVSALLRDSRASATCILDSCGVSHLGSHLLIAGISPVERLEVSYESVFDTLKLLDKKLGGDLAAIFTISYDFGLKMAAFESRHDLVASPEPDIYLALFDTLVVHDYDTGKTFLCGNADKFDELREKLTQKAASCTSPRVSKGETFKANFTRAEYLAGVEQIKERIRDGDTYQTNLTQQLTVELSEGVTPEMIFARLRRDHPAPFSAYIKRPDSTVVSASPERFFKVTTEGGNTSGSDCAQLSTISTSPIKGTRRRGTTAAEDDQLRRELLSSEKDRAENTMIVDLLRNDLGRVCEFGSVHVEKLCDLEEHPTLFHLVSTISGKLREEVNFSDILRAVFPCGSITGAPKISTMKIIDAIETTNRGLPMGAIGYYVPDSWDLGLGTWDLSVAIRTMVIRDGVATFNVGGGITIDSDPQKEYDETLLKAKALLAAIADGTISC